MVKKKIVRARERILSEGGSETLTVRRFMGDVSASLSRKILRYLKVSPGDKLQILAHNGVIEVSPVLSVKEEIEKYISH